MKFRKCSIQGQIYGNSFLKATDSNGVQLNEHERIDYIASLESSMKIKTLSHYQNPYFSDCISFIDESIVDEMRKTSMNSNEILFFFIHIAICHTVIPSQTNHKDNQQLRYKAQSPDEEALVDTARDLGITFLSRNNNILELDVLGEKRLYEILNIIEFTSSRKRMSTIVRFPSGQIYVLCKGADSVIYDLLHSDPTNSESMIRETTLRHLEGMANEGICVLFYCFRDVNLSQGLRTLCFAYREVSEEEYVIWSQKYSEASVLLEHREEAMEKVASRMEKDLTLIGASGIEDLLQEGIFSLEFDRWVDL
jgi:phospholipid-translocating ATPase